MNEKVYVWENDWLINRWIIYVGWYVCMHARLNQFPYFLLILVGRLGKSLAHSLSLSFSQSVSQSSIQAFPFHFKQSWFRQFVHTRKRTYILSFIITHKYADPTASPYNYYQFLSHTFLKTHHHLNSLNRTFDSILTPALLLFTPTKWNLQAHHWNEKSVILRLIPFN